MGRTKKLERKIGGHSAQDMQKAIQLAKDGRSIHKAAVECNLKYSTLRRYVDMAGVTKNDIKFILPTPKIDGSSRRQTTYKFAVNLALLNFPC